jgi:hypothetical protein
MFAHRANTREAHTYKNAKGLEGVTEFMFIGYFYDFMERITVKRMFSGVLP